MFEMKPEKYPELLQDLADKLAVLLTESGLDPERAERLGKEAAEHVRQEWGGQQIYVPKGVVYEYSKQHLEIYNKYRNNADIVELSHEYNLSQQAVYLIVRKMRERQQHEQQPSLFDTMEG